MGGSRGVPVAVYVPSRGTFRVVREVGKAFSSGGFGVSVPDAEGGGGVDVQVSYVIEAEEERLCVAGSKEPSSTRGNGADDAGKGDGDDGDDASAEEVGVESSGSGSGDGDDRGEVKKEEEEDGPDKKRRRRDTADEEDSIPDKNGTIVGIDAKERAEASAEDDETKSSQKSAAGKSSFHLFVEEAIFLYCRGLLRVLSEDGSSELSMKELFDLLPRLNVPLACYLTYAHLRAQTYVVLRHTAHRGELCWRLGKETEAAETAETAAARKGEGGDRQEEEKEVGSCDHNNDNDDVFLSSGEERGEMEGTGEKGTCAVDDSEPMSALPASRDNGPNPMDNAKSNKCGDSVPDDDGGKKKLRSGWKLSRRRTAVRSLAARLRDDDACAPPPRLIESRSVNGTGEVLPLAFDVYKPRSNFRKRNPGPPDYRVAVGHFSEPSPPFDALLRLASGINDAACAAGEDKEEEKGGSDQVNAPSPPPPIPVRLAVVADGGTVIMFALTDYGIPTIAH